MILGDTWETSRLVVRDLRYEWILSLCMVFALGAVLSPLFILLGLQEGLVGSMLDKIRYDPESRMVTPRYPVSHPLSEDWLATLRGVADVIVASRTSGLLLDVEQLPAPVNTLPVIAEDPVLVENRIELPLDQPTVILSKQLAKDTGKEAGDRFSIDLQRNVGREEHRKILLPISGIVPDHEFGERKLWIPLGLFNEIDRWRDGQALPLFGFPGAPSGLDAEYDGVIAVSSTIPPATTLRYMLARRLSFSQPPTLVDVLPLQPNDDRVQLLWQQIDRRISEHDITDLADRHNEQGLDMEWIPYVRSFPIDLRIDGQTKRMEPLILARDPLCPDTEKRDVQLPCVAVSEKTAAINLNIGTITFKSGIGQAIDVPVRLVKQEGFQAGTIALPQELAGRINASRYRDVRYDPSTSQFNSVGTGLRFFRAYAETIDDIDRLIDEIVEHGKVSGEIALTEPVSQIGQIQQVRWLADSLQRLYLLIAVVSGISGFFAVAANVYAGVQRKRVDLAYLQLLGINRVSLILFPLLKSLFLVVGAISVALLSYWIFAESASRVLADLLHVETTFTRLDVRNATMVSVVIIACSSVASLLASISVLRIEPGSYIRE